MKWAAVVPLLLVLTLAPPARADAQSPQALVRDTSEQMLAALRANRETIKNHPERIYDLVHKIVLPHFDFESMARSVLGKYWRRANADQRRRFVAEFRTLLVRTYASSLADYEDQQVDYLPMRPGGDPNEARVRTEIQQKSGFPVPIDYDLVRKNGVWKVTGVTIDGLNLVTNYRTTFGTEIRQAGLDGLIEKLRARNRQASR